MEFLDFLVGFADRVIAVDRVDLGVDRWPRSGSEEDVDAKITFVPKQLFDGFVSGVLKALEEEGDKASKTRLANSIIDDLLFVEFVGFDMMFVSLSVYNCGPCLCPLVVIKLFLTAEGWVGFYAQTVKILPRG